MEPVVQNEKTTTCCTCGFEWQTGTHGGHSCSEVLLKRIETLDREMAALRKTLGPTEPGGWDRGKTVIWITRWAQGLLRDAGYLMDNLSRIANSEADFRHSLEHGMGMDNEAIDVAVDEAQVEP